MKVLVLDIGSTSVKAGLWTGRSNSRGKFLSRIQVEFKTTFNGNRVEIPPALLLASIKKAGKSALNNPAHIDAISFCALSSGVVVTDSKGNPRAGVITHADRRSTQTAHNLVTHTGKKWWLSRTGNLPYPGGIGASTLAWLHQNAPKTLTPGCRVGQVSSLIGHMLTGNWITDPSQATFLGLWDIRRAKWNPEVCALVGVPIDGLPHVQWADEILGNLTPAIARAWGLPSGIPVVGGLIDTSGAIIQTPMHAGQLVHNAGSTDVLAMCLDKPSPAEGILTRPVGVGKTYPQKWLAVNTIASAGSALNWVRQTMFRDLSDSAWEKTSARAAHSPVPAKLYCIPYFAGQRAAIEQSIGATFTGIKLGTSREDLLAALIHGLARESATGYSLLRAIHPPRREVFTMGGARPLADSMHKQWPGKHTFRRLQAESLQGLAELATRALS